MNPEELRASVRTFRDEKSSEEDRKSIMSWWKDNDIPNQFAAMIKAAELERENGGFIKTYSTPKLYTCRYCWSQVESEDKGKHLDYHKNQEVMIRYGAV